MFNEKPIIFKWVADMYEQEVTETADVDFLLSLIGQAPKQILEVCCGRAYPCATRQSWT